MTANNFIKEVTVFVKEYLPHTTWSHEKEHAVLFLEEGKRSICFLSNAAIHRMHDLPYRFYITEYHWLKNKEASKSRLCSLMGLTRRIHARQTSVQRISKAIAKPFIETNHTMGYAESQFNYGLYLKEDLVAAACFSKGRSMRRLPAHKKSYELVRFCNKNYFTVVGGLSKLIRAFELEESPGDIMTYVDISWGEPFAFYALGFVLDKFSDPVTKTIETQNEKDIAFTNKGNYKLIKHLV